MTRAMKKAAEFLVDRAAAAEDFVDKMEALSQHLTAEEWLEVSNMTGIDILAHLTLADVVVLAVRAKPPKETEKT